MKINQIIILKIDLISLIDIEEHINMDSAFLNKDLKYNKYFNHINLFDTNTQQNQTKLSTTIIR